MNEQNIHFQRERANDGIHDQIAVNGCEIMTIKDCIIGVLVTFGILVMYAVAGALEAV